MDQACTEAELQAVVIEAAERGGWLVFHDNDSRRNRPGFPDLVLVRPPEVIFCELKTMRGKTTPEQREWIEALQSCSVVSAGVLRPNVSAPMVRRLLDKAPKPAKVVPIGQGKRNRDQRNAAAYDEGM
jgi:hypothetical protein